MTSKVKVSVIVPVWNDERRVVKCINALKNQQFVPEAYEIIIIDNGSTDRTFEEIQGIEGITVFQELKPGSYAARNKGLSVAKGHYVAFTDSDCVPDKNWLASLIECAETQRDIGVVAGDVSFFKDEADEIDDASLAYESFFSMNQEEYARKGVCITANWLSKKKTLLELGGFNAKLKSGGDHDMAKRLTNNGLSVVFCKQAVVAHPARNKQEILKKRRRVIGGSWDKTDGKLKSIKLLWEAVKLYIKRTLLVFFSNEASLKQRLSVFGIISAIFFVSLSEIAKLTVGQQSTRS
ncbi:glycosyltransferase family 2 protein [Alteromonas sp.]|uniref:glycosyltransferase n=1 Tax=Alteromonas sp. TaxID=232 RepID=UPI000C49EA27|nr:glycosyltransferase family 2 protein [Alteromonas sp.]MAI36953.1 dolichyl-phosphate mannose synthase [Alteromonas sp.]|tara:strand:+ start:3316 stop:4197 length:882 start_codon:yes stop_codon:yes gene_type:complete